MKIHEKKKLRYVKPALRKGRVYRSQLYNKSKFQFDPSLENHFLATKSYI